MGGAKHSHLPTLSRPGSLDVQRERQRGAWSTWCIRRYARRLISTLTVVQNLVGLAVGPVLAGWLFERYGLTTALGVVPPLYVVSAAMFRCGFRFYERDPAAVLVVGDTPAPARPQRGYP